jgi:hypothetical protein
VARVRTPRVLADLSATTTSPSPDIADDDQSGGAATLPLIRVFDLADVLRRLHEIHGNDDGFYDDLGTVQSGNLSSEEQLRSRRLYQLAQDARGGYRSPLIATALMLAEIGRLMIIAQQFESVIGVVANAAAMSLATGRTLQVPPILLFGPPGIARPSSPSSWPPPSARRSCHSR